MPHDEDEMIVRLFAEAVPEIAAGIVEIKAVARVAAIRSKLAVSSHDPNVDSIGVCVGVRGCRIKNVVDRLEGERIDLVRWQNMPERLICNALQPAVIDKVILHPAQHRATVVVKEDQFSLALGRRGINRDLASRLTGWEIEIVTK
jgi:N utilization substance protein A